MGLTMIPGLTRKHMNKLLQRFESAEQIWHLPSEALAAHLKIDQETANEIIQKRKAIDLEAKAELLYRAGIKVITRWEFPALLQEIYDPPVLLYAKGRCDLLNKHSGVKNLAVVGTRKMSAYGAGVLQKMLPELIAADLTIVSGLARGIDAKAHELCLQLNGNTIAVLGSGLDVIYPASHRELAQRISETGLLLSEYFPGTQPQKYHFPQRNRVISGLSRGVLVIEAPQKSGALITAIQALEENREVFAVPGNITSPNSEGCNTLIADGAKLIAKPEEILTEYGLACRMHRQEAQKTNLFSMEAKDLNEKEKKLLDLIPYTHEIALDELADSAILESTKALHSLLLHLELGGWIVRRPGGYLLRLK